MMRTDTPHTTTYLKDYTPYPFELLGVQLNFDIHDGYTIVESTIDFKRIEHTADHLYLNGEDLDLIALKINGKDWDRYEQTPQGVTIDFGNLDQFTLSIITKIVPEKNTYLEGLYKSGDTYCTQCEAEGFRRITYFPDRPDVLTTYTVRIEADKSLYPVLLSNGNKTESSECGNNRHCTIWHDPHPKPCYLFALVAGNLTHIHDTFTTMSGRNVDLYIYVRPGDEGQCDHAMRSLKNAMRWDEEVYGLEYDLDLFNIVAVSDFNMGAMENKSLNIFNTALVLAAQETATDLDFQRVESVIAHEYFHNWSGNRVTCRDWFQLSLKEGLTVFRDQEFSADMNSAAVQRIDDVIHLRRHQFPEDASPLAHPVRPDNYIEINNFYTMTVYEKGAELIRMTRNILGPELYRKATDLYFTRHDGQAVTCDDWIACMEETSGYDLSQFKLWYAQAGTPEVEYKGNYDEKTKEYTVHLTQNIKDTPGQKNKAPMHIPISFCLLGRNGKELIPSTVLDLKEREQSFTFCDIPEHPTPSILRGFSAPVKLNTDLSEEDLSFLMVHDTDGFNRWESGQNFMIKTIKSMAKTGSKSPSEEFLHAYEKTLSSLFDKDTDMALLARALTIPDISTIAQHFEVIDPDMLHAARHNMLTAIKRNFKPILIKAYKAMHPGGKDFEITSEAMGRRALNNTLLSIITCTGGTGCAGLAKDHYDNANTMTDRLAALSALSHMDQPQRKDVIDDFYTQFENYPLVIDKWFAVQAASSRQNTVSELLELAKHAAFNNKNPNRARALYAGFAMNNPLRFHSNSGAGYEFLTEAIIELNTINPQIAARLLTPMREWRRYTPDRQEKMQACLNRILACPDLSPNVYEIVSKSLHAA